MSEEKPTLSRTERSRATKANKKQKKQQQEKDYSLLNKILNVLISVVAMLIIISLIIIFTNDEVPNPFSKTKQVQQSEELVEQVESPLEEAVTDTEETEPIETVTEETNSSDAEETSQQGEAEEAEATTSENSSEQATEEVSELAYIAKVESSDTNVEVAYVDIRWQPYPTSQKGPHFNHFDANHIDYQEKIAHLYAVSGYTEETSILWNFKNQKGDAVAVISSLDKKNIFRVTMTWVPDRGWQTILIEQLKSLAGAY